MTEGERPAGPYWRTLIDGRTLPKLDLGTLILERFQATAARILCEDFELTLGADGLPDITELTPERFDSHLGALVGRFTLAYIDTIRDVFVEHLRDALGGAEAEPEGSDEWQVGSLNVYPEEGWQLEQIAEELHDALLLFGPAEGAFRIEVGTIAGRVWSSLTDDLGITMAHPAYRDGVFDPKLFARIMESQFIDTGTFGMLSTLMVTLQKVADAAEGGAGRAGVSWPASSSAERSPSAAPPWATAGTATVASLDLVSAKTEATPAPEEAPTTSPNPPQAQPKPAPQQTRQAPGTSSELEHFFGRLFGSAPPPEADDDPA